jgi:hypothetical protein
MSLLLNGRQWSQQTLVWRATSDDVFGEKN